MPIQDFTDHSLSQLLDLSGRAAVITGGAKGLGKAIAQRLHEAGATVYLADLDEHGARESAGELGERAHAVQLDAADRDANVQLAERVREEQGSLDIWVNNAGIYPFSSFNRMAAEEWAKVVDVNLNGVFYGAQAASRLMAEQGSGVIINIASTAGYGAEGGGIAHYCATKHAVRGLTKAMAFELGPKNVRCVAIAPTLIETPGTLAARDQIAQNSRIADPHEAMAKQIPLRRVGKPDDVARVALFLASDLAAFVSGDTVLVDGGLRSR